MRSECLRWSDALAALAEGRQDAEASIHVQGCVDCGRKVAQLRAMLASASLAMEDAPVEAISRAKRLMAPVFKRATLRQTTLGLVGARSSSDTFQAVFDVDSGSARVMYSKSESGWLILGQFSSGTCTIERDDLAISSDDEGRFTFESSELSDTAFILRYSEQPGFAFPSGQEIVDGLR
ncbi:hypothetical protein BH11ARM1_BH11ARM1_06460 [soil metagenome]